jgi:hypothetical protein
MCPIRLRAAAAMLGAAFLLAGEPALGQSGEPKGEQPKQQPPGDAAKDQKKVDEFAEAMKALGSPAGNPECVWLGKRAVRLLWRDDLDTAFRHLDVYDRFGCPGSHIQIAFRCVVRQGDIDPKAPIDPKSADRVDGRLQACWINPNLPPTTAAATPGTASPETR